jgi:hypothetical protein
MNFLPVAARELRLLARRSRTYHIRDLSALLVIVTSLGMLYAGFGGLLSPSSAGAGLFVALSGLGAVYVLLDGSLVTADCISRENRDGTLELMLLTDLRGYDIIAGKLVSQGAYSAYALVAALPGLGIALFLGGVTGLDFLRMILALLNGLFYSAAFGVLVSACSRRERQALSVAVFGVIGLTCLLPMLGWGLSLWRQTGAIHPGFLIGSPAGAFLLALQAAPTGLTLPYSFSESLLGSQLLAWIFLGVASWLVTRAWHEPATTDRDTSVRGLWSGRWSLLSGLFRRRRWNEEDPVIWASARRGESGLGIWPVVVVFAMSWGAGWYFAGGQWSIFVVYPATVFLLHLALTYFVIVQACRTPVEDQRTGVLEILLTTPLGDDAYLRGRMLSLKRQCFWPVLLVLAIDLGLAAAGSCAPSASDWEWLAWTAGTLVLVLRLLVDLYTVGWVGLWQGLKTANTGRAIRKTIWFVFVWRWLVLLALLALIGVLTTGKAYEAPFGAVLAGVGYLTLPFLSLQNLGRALSEVKDDLRGLALGRTDSEPAPIWWKPWRARPQV